MTSAADDLEALFDEVAAQRVQAEPAAPAESVVDQAPAGNAAPEHSNAADKPMFERLGGIVRYRLAVGDWRTFRLLRGPCPVLSSGT